MIVIYIPSMSHFVAKVGFIFVEKQPFRNERAKDTTRLA